jgi:hypothetical protein
VVLREEQRATDEPRAAAAAGGGGSAVERRAVSTRSVAINRVLIIEICGLSSFTLQTSL